MDLEEKSIEQIGDRCEECGAKLTPAELQAAMESGGPALCAVRRDDFARVPEKAGAWGEEWSGPPPRITPASAAHREHDVAELAAGGEPVIRGGRLLKRVGRRDRRPDRA